MAKRKVEHEQIERPVQVANGDVAPEEPAAPKAKRKTHTAKVSATFRHLDPSPAIQSYAQRKFGQIARFLRRDASIHLILSVDKYRHCGEATVKAGRLSLKTAYEEGRDIYAVIDALVAKVKRQITEQTRKIRERRTRAVSANQLLGARSLIAPALKNT